MNNFKLRYLTLLIVMVSVFTSAAADCFAALSSIDDKYFKYYASYEDGEFKADNVGLKGKKWTTKQPQQAGDYFIIDMLETRQAGQVIIEQIENNYPGVYNVYASEKRENLINPIITGAKGAAGVSLKIDFPEIVSCRFIKIELCEGTQINPNPWDVVSVSVMPYNDSSRKVAGYEVIESDSSDDTGEKDAVFERIGLDFSSYDGTKSEFAKIISQFYGLDTVSYENSRFQDVNDGSKNYEYIMIMSAICKITDAMFYPDNEISVAEALKYILDVMGYRLSAVSAGGYPSGYITEAVQLGIVKSNSDFDAVADVQTLKNIIYKALFSPVVRQTSYGQDSEFTVSDDVTCASYWHNLERIEGLLISTGVSSVAGNAFVPDNTVLIDETTYLCDVFAEYLLGCQVTAIAVNEDDIKEIIYIRENPKYNKSITIPADNIVDYNNYGLRYVVNYPYSDSIKTCKIDSKADMIYNSSAKVPFDESLMRPVNGYIRLIDNDRDGTYEVVSVNEYVNYIISYIDKEKMIISDLYGKSNIEVRDSNMSCKFLKDGKTVEFKDITEGMVASVFADSAARTENGININSDTISALTVILSEKAVTGTVTSISNEDNLICIDGIEYFTDKDYLSTADAGLSVKPVVGESFRFKFDYENKISDVQYANTTETKYALLLGMYIEEVDSEEDVVLRVLTTEGTHANYRVNKKVVIDGEKQPVDFSQDIAKMLFWEDIVLEKIDEVTGAVQTYTQYQLIPQVIGYRLNENGQIKYLDTKAFNPDKESSETSLNYRPVSRYTCNVYRGMIYPTEDNDNPNLNYTGDANPYVFVGPVDVKSADIYADYAVYRSLYFAQDEKYDLELFKKSEFNDLEIAFVHADFSDENARYQYILVDGVTTSLTPDGEVRSKLYGVKNGEHYEAFFYTDTVLESTGITLNRGDLIIAETNSRGEIASVTRLVDISDPQLKLSKNGKYYAGERITIGQVYNSNGKNLLVTSTKRASDPDAENVTELFMLPDTAICYNQSTDEIKSADLNDILAYKKTNSENMTSVIYACTTWGLHQSFVIYNFEDYIPDV